MPTQKDPSEMSDEELNAALAGEEPEVLEEEPDEEPQEDPVEEPETAEAPEELEEEPEAPLTEAEKPPSRREQLRIKDLLSRPQPQAAPQPPPPSDAFDYGTLEADPELVKKLEVDRKRASDHSYNQAIEQVNVINFRTRLEVDSPRVDKDHPILDKRSKTYKQEVADAINTMYLTTVGYQAPDAATNTQETVRNPTLRYSDYVDSIFELATELAGEMTKTTVKTIKRQAAQTGLRPDGSSPKRLNLNQHPSDMSDEELDAAIKAGLRL